MEGREEKECEHESRGEVGRGRVLGWRASIGSYEKLGWGVRMWC
jgi:hypothetical protein